MTQQGKFIVFDNLTEFSGWLMKLVVNRQITLIQNHHTEIPAYEHYKNQSALAWQLGFEYEHIKRGYGQIAQHLTTYPDGKIAVGRSFEAMPAGIMGANYGAICMEHFGNFDKDAMTDIHRKTILGVNAWLCQKFNLDPNTRTILYHHWYDIRTGKRTNGTGIVKTCPGTRFFNGNTVEACSQYFIPEVENYLRSL